MDSKYRPNLSNLYVNREGGLYNKLYLDNNSDNELSCLKIGIVSKDGEVPVHVAGTITLVIYDTERDETTYESLDLGPRKEEGGQPGVNLNKFCEKNNITRIAVGRQLAYSGNITYDVYAPGTSVEDVLKDYRGLSTEEINALIEGKGIYISDKEEYKIEAGPQKVINENNEGVAEESSLEECVEESVSEE